MRFPTTQGLSGAAVAAKRTVLVNVVDDEPLTKREYAEALARAAPSGHVAARARPGRTAVW
jgi:hypothetical protein